MNPPTDGRWTDERISDNFQHVRERIDGLAEIHAREMARWAQEHQRLLEEHEGLIARFDKSFDELRVDIDERFDRLATKKDHERERRTDLWRQVFVTLLSATLAVAGAYIVWQLTGGAA